MLNEGYGSMSAYMNVALNLARNNLGNTMPNPTVGCIIVNSGRIVGRGSTALSGRPHAEQCALDAAGEHALGSTAYVTLEPCVHHGETPPCIDSLIKAEVRRVVVAVKDPDNRVNGAGIAKLRSAGISVDYGICRSAAKFLNIGHFYNKLYGRPFVTLKIATTLDGKIASRGLDSKWITSKMARNVSHKIRSINDAVLVGSGTVLRDDPLLTCRLVGLEHTSPIKIILSNQDNLHNNMKIFQSGETWIIGAKSSIANGTNIKNIVMSSTHIGEVLSVLAEKGITRLMVEGGQSVVTQFIKEDFVDQIMWFRAFTIAGGDALSVFGDLGCSNVGEFPHFVRVHTYMLGEDNLDVLLRSLTEKGSFNAS